MSGRLADCSACDRRPFGIPALGFVVAMVLASLTFAGPRTEARPAGVDHAGELNAVGSAAVAAGSGSTDRSTDFDGDGISDVLWYAPGSAPDYLWTGGVNGFASQSVVVSVTSTAVVGDFDGNGADDVLWYAPGTADDHLWSGSSSGFSSRAVSVGGSYQPVVADFDGNGADDILWYAPGPAADFLWTGSSSGFSSRAVSVGGSYQPVVGDFDGNGASDIVWYAPGGAADYLWRWSAGGFRSTTVSVGGSYQPVVGDFDGNGADDIVWYAPGAASDYRWRWSGGMFRSSGVTVSGTYRPVVGDFDGNGADDIVWYAPGSGADFLWSGTSGGFRSAALAIGGSYQPVTGDFDGDGRTDILWYAPGTPADYLWHSGDGSRFASRSFSINGHYTPLGRGVVQSAPLSTAPYAASGGTTLRLPAANTLYVGFHQSASPYAVDQVPQSMPVRWAVLPSRHRGTGDRTSADLVLPRGQPVLAPATGVVVEARAYSLYGRYSDEFLAIASSTSGDEVLVLHLTGLRIRPGDHVVAGVTEIATEARRLPFRSQVDDYSGHSTSPHIHVEISSRPGYRDPDIFS